MEGGNSQYYGGHNNGPEGSVMDDEDLIAEQDHLLQLRDALELKNDEECKEDIL